MKKSNFTEEQVAYALRQVEAGAPVLEVCRKLGITEQTFYRWKKKFAGMGVAELRRLRQLEEENRKLKQLVADLTLDKHILQEVLSKKYEAGSKTPASETDLCWFQDQHSPCLQFNSAREFELLLQELC